MLFLCPSAVPKSATLICCTPLQLPTPALTQAAWVLVGPLWVRAQSSGHWNLTNRTVGLGPASAASVPARPFRPQPCPLITTQPVPLCGSQPPAARQGSPSAAAPAPGPACTPPADLETPQHLGASLGSPLGSRKNPDFHLNYSDPEHCCVRAVWLPSQKEARVTG